MVWHPTKDAVKRLWGRRWIRRVSFAVVAGAALYTGGPWLATRPVVLRWVLGHLDRLVQEETGLPLTIGRVEFRPGRSALIFHDVHLGGDLLTVERLEFQADLLSLLSPSHRVHALRVEHPHLRLTEAGLQAVRLKRRPPRTEPLPRFHLDVLSLTGGELTLPEPLRGVPALHYQFELKGVGQGPNQIRLDLTGPQLAVKGPGGWDKGRLDLHGDISEPALVLHEAYLRLEDSQVRLNGRYTAATPKSPEHLEARLTGVLDLIDAARWSGTSHPPLVGTLDLVGTLQGSLQKPAWTLSADGQDLRPGRATFLPGTLDLKASGSLEHATLDSLRWSSPQGGLEAQAAWTRSLPLKAQIQGTNLDLATLGLQLRLEELKDTRGTFQAELQGPKPGDSPGRLDRWQGSLQAGFTQRGVDAGGLRATLDRGRASLDQLSLNLEALKLDGRGQATLGPRGLDQFEGEGAAEVGADQVAQALATWGVVKLDMAGAAQAQASVRWSRANGLGLQGTVAVVSPRWHGAHADHLQGQVEIQGSDLWVRDIQVRKGEGSGGGDLWLTWRPLPPGQSQMDMCYTAHKLPVAEGLRAADLKTPEGKDLPISGLASGWVRLQGPFAAITMNGSAQVESGESYGITIPAASTDFWMDIPALRLKLSKVKIAERPDLLGAEGVAPEGALALTGQADMDFSHWTWWTDLHGRLDTQLLALPGPRLQSQVDATLLGPITTPFGALELPEGRVALKRGRLFFGDRSLDGIEGQASLERGRLEGRLGMEGQAKPLLAFQAARQGLGLAGDLSLSVSPDSAPTEALARSLTEDLLEDLSLSATVKGRWDPRQELTWSGTLDQLAARFSAFELHQSRPSALHGNAKGAVLDVALDGGARQQTDLANVRAAHLRLAGTIPFSNAAPLALQAEGEADLAHLKSILDLVMEVDDYNLLSDLDVQGTSRFRILAHGSYLEPLLDGTLSLEKGQAHLRGYQGIEDLQAQVVLKDRTITIPEDLPVRGTLAHGDLRLTGGMSWQLGGIESYALKASLGGFQLRDMPDGLDLQGSLQANLEGTDTGGVLKGKLRADRLSYQTEVKLADLILRSALSDTGTLTGLDLDDPLDRIRLDLDLTLQSPWTFDTNLLKLEGRTEGPFQVVGTLSHPVPKGTLVFQPGGRLTNIFPAGDMVVDRGSLAFSEARALDPLIAIQGSVTSIPGYTVNLDIRGTLSNLTIIPTSTPSLRQDEIMAILINPGSVASVGTAGATSGATQGALSSGLASASTGLLSTLAFAPLQDQLRRTLGLDRVSVALRPTTQGTTETEVTFGKSISLLGQRSAVVVSHKKTGELAITSGQVEWRFGGFVLQLGASKGGDVGLSPSGEIRHTWSPK
jgi:hypothetical protein